jgi:DNA-binding NarL/FixJ family response regulator
MRKPVAPFFIIPPSPAHAALKCGLSERDVQIAELAARGLDNQAIADRTGLKRNSVKWYMTVVLRKLGVKDRYELIRFWIEYVERRGDCGTCTLRQAHITAEVASLPVAA